MATVEFTEALASEYRSLFAQARIRPEQAAIVDSVVNRIFKPENLTRYQQVEASTHVPAHVVGIIHNLEASSNFAKHLHNGDPLTSRTTHVPAGRPPASVGNPPFTWPVSAMDALQMHNLHQWTDWTVAGIAYVLERYNGWGYRLHHPQVKSPYLWSFSTIYSAGKYIADGTWSDTAVSRQCGGMAALKRMIEMGRVAVVAPPAEPDEGGVAITPFPDTDPDPLTLPVPPPYPGLLKLGSLGAAVTALQHRLFDLGVREVGMIDGDFGERTESAVKLFQARGVDETGEPLEIDGVVGRKTWRALFGRAMGPEAPERPAGGPAAPILQRALDVAASQVGVREHPRGSNRGPEVDQYLDSVSTDLRGQPWCMAFIYWCFGQAATELGVPNPAPRTASVHRSWEMAQRPGVTVVKHDQAVRDPTLVRPGMIFHIDTGGRTGHAGFVVDVVGGKLVTIEGNTNDDGSREGIGVFNRTSRRISSISLGFVAFA